MNRVFIGVDERQLVAYHVLCSSIMRHATKPVSIIPLLINQLPIERRGITGFTFSRYLPPYLCNYEGMSLFLDSDMLVTGDVNELFESGHDEAVSIVNFPAKLAFERPSVMLFNNEKCKNLSLEYIDSEHTAPQSLEWAESIGELPPQWNYLVGYSPAISGVKLIHYTMGIPGYKECRTCEFANEWFQEREIMLSHVSWLELNGRSVHAPIVIRKLQEGL